MKAAKRYIITHHRLIAAALVLSAVCCQLPAKAYALDIRRSVLPNGLTVLQVERHNLPIIMVSLLVKASPLGEPVEKAGLANLTSQLIAAGTKKRKATDISQEVEFIGAELGSSAENDFTLVTLSVLKKDLEKGFEIFSDVVLNPVFPEEEIKRNKELVKGSLRQSEEDPSFIAKKAFKNAVYRDLPYGRLVRGSTETIDRIGRDDIVRFHSDYYRPNNSVLVVVGDLTEKELRSLIDRFLLEWKASAVPDVPSVPLPRPGKEVIRIDRDLTQATIVLGHAGIRRSNPDYYAVSVMNYVLGGGGFSSRLMQTVRDDMGLAYDIHSYFSSYEDGGTFKVVAQTKDESAGTVVEEIYRQVRKITGEQISDQELEDAKAYLTGSFPRRLDTNRKIADFLVAVEFYELGLDYIEKYPEYIKSVTREDVLKVADKYLDIGHLVTVVVGKQANISLRSE
ncbi:MAG TPA: pitrilysin family protein [Thermodesulfovibrionales bacterium]|nr:pitrilysin family protein [Thermodesulfovibrionales bacterium]